MTFVPSKPEPLSALLARVESTPDGLSSVEAQRRLRAAAPTTIGRWPAAARLVEVVRGAANPLVLVLSLAGVASAFLGQIADAVIIGAIVMMSAAIDSWQTLRSEQAVKRLQARVAPTATVRRDGRWIDVARGDLVVGDVIRLAAGDLVPADARLLTALDLHADQAALTGESLPAEKLATGDPPDAGPDSPQLVFLGTSIVGGTGTAVVFATGKATSFGDIVERLAEQPAETEFERGTRRFGMLILVTVVCLVLFILAVNLVQGRDPLQSLLFSVALAVGLTPEFLPMITTVTLARGAMAMAREKVIVKHLSAIQNLGSIDVLCSDKTGTLTLGAMSLESALDPFGTPSENVLLLGHLNSALEMGIKSPLETAILARPCAGTEGFEKTDEIPFDFERRRLSVIVRRRGTLRLLTKGAPESVLSVCTRFEADGRLGALDEAARARALETFRASSALGLRMLAVAYRDVECATGLRASDERELVLAGFLTFADPIAPDAAQSIARLRDDGVRVKIVTGDNELVTRHVCALAGIEDASEIALGSEIEALDDARLALLVERVNVFARVSPAQKHRILSALKKAGHVVGFLGDGINDAPSLHAADVGISVAGAVDIAREAADIVLLERNLGVLHAGIVAGRRAFGNVLKYILMGTSSNFGNMFSMAGAALLLPFLPMLPTQILLNNFLYDFAQITIPTDHVDEASLRRPQRWDMRVIRRFMLTLGPISSLYDFLTFAVLSLGFRAGETFFHTGWFMESLATQTLVLFVIRTVGRPWKSLPSVPLTITTLLVVAIGIALPYTPLAPWLGLEPMPATFFLYLVPAVATYLGIVELVKSRVIRRIMASPVVGHALLAAPSR